MTPRPLTPGQQRILDVVTAAYPGSKTFNGRARTQVEALERRDLVTVDWDLRPTPGRWTEAITVTLKES